jgi:hypothetical protein
MKDTQEANVLTISNENGNKVLQAHAVAFFWIKLL